ncbi:hypothetical protein TSAR_011409, partial [Trichomalopsis sarcophagae]
SERNLRSYQAAEHQRFAVRSYYIAPDEGRLLLIMMNDVDEDYAFEFAELWSQASKFLSREVIMELTANDPVDYLYNNHPWQPQGASGYTSSASPPNSRSSSANSNTTQSYGYFADEVNAEEVINSLLQIIGGEEYSIQKEFKQYSAQSANETRCRKCTDRSLCVACTAQTLQLNALCSNEQLMLHPLAGGALSLENKRYDNPTSMLPFFCGIHAESERFYCKTCCRPFCAECEVMMHEGHMTVNTKDTINTAAREAMYVMHEAQLGIESLQTELITAEAATEMLNEKARTAASDVVISTRRLMNALEQREKELLESIETMRTAKYVTLKAREEILKNGISRLTQAHKQLNELVETATVDSNPFDLVVTKDAASAEVFQVRHAKQYMAQLSKETWISFISGEDSAVRMIGNYGNISDNNPGSIGDRRTVRRRGQNAGTNSPRNAPPPYQNNAQPIIQAINANQQNRVPVLSPIPSGCGVPAVDYRVAVRSGRSGRYPFGLVKPIKSMGCHFTVETDNLCRPWGVACDKEGNIVVADRSNNRIQIFRQNGSLLRRFGQHGNGPVEFNRPAGVAVDGRRRIIVADKDNHRIQVLTIEGHYLMSFGERGHRCGQFNYPWDVAVNSDCQIAVSDTRNHRVQLFSAEGVFLRKYGFETTPNVWKHFDSPRGVAFDPEGNLVVTDFNNHRIVMVEPDYLNVRVVIPESHNGVKQFLRPQGLVIDDEGNYIISDSRHHRIQIFNSAGELKWTYGKYGTGIYELDRPAGIALSPDGRIVVVDFGNNRVMLI